VSAHPDGTTLLAALQAKVHVIKMPLNRFIFEVAQARSRRFVGAQRVSHPCVQVPALAISRCVRAWDDASSNSAKDLRQKPKLVWDTDLSSAGANEVQPSSLPKTAPESTR
jgi:hypothetical protein